MILVPEFHNYKYEHDHCINWKVSKVQWDEYQHSLRVLSETVVYAIINVNKTVLSFINIYFIYLDIYFHSLFIKKKKRQSQYNNFFISGFTHNPGISLNKVPFFMNLVEMTLQ